MTDRYVGPGGSDGNGGLSWADRKLTFNGVEDTPVVAGDTVYVGPGIYRELLTVDVNGTGGNIITYIGDVTGENTDGVGGLIRITGIDSEDSYPAARSQCIYMANRSYRTFRGIYLGEVNGTVGEALVKIIISAASVTDVIFEFCYFASSATSYGSGAEPSGAFFLFSSDNPFSNFKILNCIFEGGYYQTINWDNYTEGGDILASGGLIENCVFNHSYYGPSFIADDIYGMTVRGCSFLDCYFGIYFYDTAAANDSYVYDNHFKNSADAVKEYTAGAAVCDYNFYNGTGTDASKGANHLTSFLPDSLPIMLSGYKYPWEYMKVSNYNDNIYTADYSNLTTDLYGLPRGPNGKNTRGAIQFRGVMRDGTEYRTAPSSARMDDASQQIITVPVNGGKKVSVTMYVKREADYTGTNPQLAIRSPTQGETIVTDSGSSGSYNKLSLSVVPSDSDRWLQIELRSNNTATSGNYKVWFDSFKIQTAKGIIPTMKWATAEMPQFAFALSNLVDPWITPTIPIPVQAEIDESFHPFPAFYRQS